MIFSRGNFQRFPCLFGGIFYKTEIVEKNDENVPGNFIDNQNRK